MQRNEEHNFAVARLYIGCARTNSPTFREASLEPILIIKLSPQRIACE